jgi:hypothetical protein
MVLLTAATARIDEATRASARLVRDDLWLASHLEELWQRHFADVPRANPVDVAFGRPWKTRLGLITLGEETKSSYIRLNALLRLDSAPEFIPTLTLAHEMVHYAHGFGSTLPRRFRHPHQGGIVNRELMARGFGHYLEPYRAWLDEHWFPFYDRHVHIFS